MEQSTTAYIGLGSNLGDRAGNIRCALDKLYSSDKLELSGVSDIYPTPPLANCKQPDYLNTVVAVNTKLKPKQLLALTRSIETNIGRKRNKTRWASRAIDLDILLYGQSIVDTPELKIPHPQMHLRWFVLKGLCQLAPDTLHPKLNRTVATLGERLNQTDFYFDPDIPQLISIAGLIGVGKTTLANQLSQTLNCPCIYEQYGDNPFLPKVYAGKRELALDSQLFFLLSRVDQLNLEGLEPSRPLVSDYLFDKEMIYAHKLLEPDQFSLYSRLYPHFSKTVAKPVLTVYLIDTLENCLQRIRNRNRPYEQLIEIELLRDFANEYNKLFEQWTTSPLIRLNINDFDCRKKGDVGELAAQIKNYIA